jgi:hypothetical protein
MQETRNPLPKGSYWISIFESDQPAWDNWSRLHSPDDVKILVTESIESKSTFWNFVRQFADGAAWAHDTAGNWVRFDVIVPSVQWGSFGYPTVVPPGAKVRSTQDVMQAPKLKEASFISQLGPWVLGGVAIWALIGRWRP